MKQRFRVDLTKRPGLLARAAIILLVSAGAALAQGTPGTAGGQRQGSGVVAGRVTIDGELARGLRVTLTPASASPAARTESTLQALTDDAGTFRLNGVPQGTFILSAASGAYVLQDDVRGATPGRTVVVREGEEVKDVELTLKRGGVITGRLTDAEGRPLVGARVSLQSLDDNGNKRPVALLNQPTDSDDRGVYRLYGLPAGRYLVSLGSTSLPDLRPTVPGATRAHFAPVFYPGVTDEAQAKVVEVKLGAEVKDVDIARGGRAESHAVAGRVVDGETGSPMPNVEVGYAKADGPVLASRGAGVRTNAAGEFRVENVPAGRHVAYAVPGAASDFYSEATSFEVSGGDVQGLQIKVRRGTSISGVAVVEGVNDPAVLARLSTVTVSAFKAGDTNALAGAMATLGRDGSFRLNGVPPGRIVLLVSAYPARDFTLDRVEQNGNILPSGMLQLAGGEQMNDVRLVLSYGKGNVTGQVTPQHGALPAGARITVNLVRPSMPNRVVGATQAAPDGRFVITNVPAGNYDLVVRTSAPALMMTRKQVTVVNGKDTEANVLLDLAQ